MDCREPRLTILKGDQTLRRWTPTEQPAATFSQRGRHFNLMGRHSVRLKSKSRNAQSSKCTQYLVRRLFGRLPGLLRRLLGVLGSSARGLLA